MIGSGRGESSRRRKKMRKIRPARMAARMDHFRQVRARKSD
jgi:hypothetical protein